ncbi:TonB-dependent siderophore receptor [Parvularcula flava]|uniref:TonB-dependent receptor n=1 Tax=Aquisalinus luteolus TaxID=1566827 RepID=A0A8J3EQ38_9PROT|nr:TonB-dependent siderophore receptor [Aquisalinus luteolus]NHK26535.1 TonB-dependent siderophore receptor [Aquisalinus luteolus]GGH92634.1 TonB-dependent receptor [Aquisalinus luteolus]
MKSFISSVSAIALLAATLPANAQDSATDEDEDIIVVTGGSQVDLTGEYAGDQVARGGRAGLLGNLDYMDAPYAGTAYTEQLIKDQQAKSVGDVLQNDPVVRVAKGFGNFQELYVIRGFPVYSDDMTYNGVYGILPRQYVAAELLERVEVFRGANSFLNGAAPGGSGVGGAFNLVPKRAGEEPLNRYTVGVENAGQFYGAADIARRFGEGDAFGVRVNAVRRDGETSIEDQERELSVLSLGTDYRTDDLRLTFDLGWQDHHIDAPRPQVTPLGDIPEAPDADTNYAQDWTYTDEEQLFGVVRGEYDLNDFVTVWAAAGGRHGEEANVLANPSAAADGTTSAYRFDNTREDDVFSADAGIRADFATGPVGHRLIASASAIQLESKNAYAFSSFAGFAGDLYDPFAVDAPAADFFIGGELSDPGKTEEVDNSSFALVDMMTFLDGKVIATIGLRNQNIETASFDYNTGDELSRYEDSATTPAFGLVYKPSETISVYGNYSESLQPGALAPASSGGTPIDNAGDILEPYRGEQVEVGIKYDGGNFGGTLSAFTLSKPNAIVIDNVFTASGEQENSGLELSVFGEPTEGLRLLGGATFIDAELSETQGGLNEGNEPIGVPELQANVNVEWDVPALPGLTLDGRVIYTGEQFVNEGNTTELDAWTRLDLGARYALTVSGKDVTLRARTENVTDDSYWASTGGFPGANYLVQAAPRTFVLSATLDM